MQRMRWAVALYLAIVTLAVSNAGCAPYVHDLSQTSASGYVDGFTSRESTDKLDALAASATAAARNKALGPATKADLQALVTAMGATLREQLVLTRDDLLDKALRVEIAKLRAELLGPETRKLVLALVDEVREGLAGAPLRADVDALLVESTPKIAALVTEAVKAALAPVKADADAEASKYKTVAIGLGAGGAVMLLALGVSLFELRRHRNLLAALLKRAGRAA